ncbi:hypothetical protein AB4K08_13840 [Serratia fonticola]|nr:hypothetical protein [Serratia fonticola]
MHINAFLCNMGASGKSKMPRQKGKSAILTKSVAHEYALSVREASQLSGNENVIKMMLF